MKEYKIYCLKNPETLEIRYIGITTQKYLSSRLSQHCFCAKNNFQTHVAKWIRKLEKKPIIEIIEICNKDNWEEREIYWINYYDNLTNILPGGKGVVVNRSLDSIQRSSQAHEKKVVQLNDEGDLINIFESITKAAEYFNAKSLSSIWGVLNNHYGNKKAYGYQWFYYEEYLSNDYTLRNYSSKVNYENINKVYLYDINNNFIKEYLSLNLLAKEIGCAYTSAKKAIKNNKLLYKKYYIRYYMI